MTQPLPLPDDPRFALMISNGLGDFEGAPFPRSKWLASFEALLRLYYPQASSDELTLTARNAAPFPLAKPGVP